MTKILDDYQAYRKIMCIAKITVLIAKIMCNKIKTQQYYWNNTSTIV